MNRSVGAAGLLAVAAAGAVGLVAREWITPGAPPSADEVCVAAADTLDALGQSVGDQVVLRARAAHLADLLVDRSAQADGAESLATARRVVEVLDDPGATVSDLAAALDPIAQSCAQRPADR